MGLATRITNEYRMPDLRNNTITMPGRHGVFDFGETVSERKILISCFIPPGKTDEQFLSKKDSRWNSLFSSRLSILRQVWKFWNHQKRIRRNLTTI